MRRLAMQIFRYLPHRVRRAAVHLGAPSYSVGAVVVMRRADGEMLLVDQRHSVGWALPGGLLRRGECPDDAVVREVAEEVGIRLDPARLPVPVAAVDANARRVDLVYVIDAPADAAPTEADGAEVRRVGWFALDALPELGDPTLDILRAIRVS